MSKNKGGRPKIEIDFKQVENLCRIQCTGEEIAGVLEVDYDTLSARIKEEYGLSFSEYYKRYSDGGKASLRRMQWRACENGNASMLIWLGKQMLGQTDKVDHGTNTDLAGAIKSLWQKNDKT